MRSVLLIMVLMSCVMVPGVLAAQSLIDMDGWDVSELSTYEVHLDSSLKVHSVSVLLERDEEHAIHLNYARGMKRGSDPSSLCFFNETGSAHGMINGRSYRASHIEYSVSYVSTVDPIKLQIDFRVYMVPERFFPAQRTKVYFGATQHAYTGSIKDAVLLEGAFIHEFATQCVESDVKNLRGALLWAGEKAREIFPAMTPRHEDQPLECRIEDLRKCS